MPRNTRNGILSNKSTSMQQMLKRAKFGKRKQNPETLISQLDIEIECPRCNEMLELCSDFDKLYYYCESCCLHLRVG
jgi:late competence protein required for DNA uptake (superfamily II DNA/RNA helicase)